MVFPSNLNLKLISKEEKDGLLLCLKKKTGYRYSRCYTRLALAQLFDMDPLSIPLFSEPGKPPSLYKGFGYVSISHCRDALLVGWSNSRIGIDIESTKRSINIDRLSIIYFQMTKNYNKKL